MRKLIYDIIPIEKIEEIIGKVKEVKSFKKRGRSVLILGLRAGLAAFLIVCLVTGFAPLKFIKNSIKALPQETKTVNFYSQVCEGKWENIEKAEGRPEVGPKDGLDSFSSENSAVYQNGLTYVICQNFISEDQLVKKKNIEEATSSKAVVEELVATTTGVIVKEATTSEESVSSTETIVISTTSTATSVVEKLSSKEATSSIIESTTTQTEENLVFPEEPEDLSPETSIPEKEFKSAKIKFSFAIGEKKIDVLSDEPAAGSQKINSTTTSENSTTSDELENEKESTSSEPISFWNRIRRFFGNQIAKAEDVVEEEVVENSSTTSEVTEPEPLDSGSTTEIIIPETTTTEETVVSTTTEIIATTTDSEATSTEPGATTTETLSQPKIGGIKLPATDSLLLPKLKPRIIIWYSLDGEVWWKLGSIYNYPSSNTLNGGYFEYDAPFLKKPEDIQNLRIKFEGAVTEETEVKAFLDSVWVEAAYEEEKEIKEEKAEIVSLSSKKTFRGDELPEFRFEYKRKGQNVLASIGGALSGVRDKGEIKTTVEIRDYRGRKLSLSPEVVFEGSDEFSVHLDEISPRQFRPGKYRLRVILEDSSSGSLEITEFEQEFIWGVLAINVSKSIFSPGEWAYLQMAALEEDGNTLCNANLYLEITTPSGRVEDVDVERSGECRGNNVTDIPDYYTYYKVNEQGVYQMKLVNLDNNYEVSDSFEVRNSVPFDIERFGPTRIYPLALYEMTIRIEAKKDFKGQIIESLPLGFRITETDAQREMRGSQEKMLIWEVDWKEGEIKELKYTFDAPDVSPYLYLLGPLELSSVSELGFEEIRKWQIASDNPDEELLRPQTNGGTQTQTTVPGNAHDASGSSTQSDTIYITNNGVNELTLYNWSSAGQSYGTATLNLYYEAQGNGGGGDTYEIQYSTDNTSGACDSSVWTDLVSANGNAAADHTLVTTTISAAQDLTRICVRLNIYKSAGPDNAHVYIEDVFTIGEYDPVANQAPSVSNVQLNGGSHIRLIEGSATTVTATATVSDNDTYSDIASVIGRLYRSGVTSTENCTIDGNNCYYNTGCSTSSCSENDCVATCNFNTWFIAEPTDDGSPWSGEHWVAWIKAIDDDNASSSATNSAQTLNVQTLNALDVTETISYGELLPGKSNDPLDKLVLATTTGNNAIDANISGYDMCTDYPTCSAATTSIIYQHYATSSGIGYGSTSAEGVWTASSSAVLLEFVTGKPTATPSSQAQSIYWGTLAPTTTRPGAYEGVNTFAVTSDS